MTASAAEPPETRLDADHLHEVLTRGTLDIEGRLVDASNATLFCRSSLDDLSVACVYKPVRGERPLWDFPDGTLAEREVAAYAVSQALGWDLIPMTVLRDGPFGTGMCQVWVEVDPAVDLVDLARGEHPDLRRMVVLDAVINNSDRKGGHLLPHPAPDRRVQGIDHGVCFSSEDKLRTVLWQWRGRPLSAEALSALERLRDDLAGGLGEVLRGLLTRTEVRRTVVRVHRLLETGTHPEPSPDWPAIPWPPF